MARPARRRSPRSRVRAVEVVEEVGDDGIECLPWGEPVLGLPGGDHSSALEPVHGSRTQVNCVCQHALAPPLLGTNLLVALRERSQAVHSGQPLPVLSCVRHLGIGVDSPEEGRLVEGQLAPEIRVFESGPHREGLAQAQKPQRLAERESQVPPAVLRGTAAPEATPSSRLLDLSQASGQPHKTGPDGGQGLQQRGVGAFGGVGGGGCACHPARQRSREGARR
jgi:hypothetical protein